MSHGDHTLSTQAQTLIIKMTQRGRQLVNLVLPAQSIKWVTKVIPEALLEMFQKAGVDLKALEERYHAQPLRQGSVLALAMPEHDRELLLYFA